MGGCSVDGAPLVGQSQEMSRAASGDHHTAPSPPGPGGARRARWPAASGLAWPVMCLSGPPGAPVHRANGGAWARFSASVYSDSVLFGGCPARPSAGPVHPRPRRVHLHERARGIRGIPSGDDACWSFSCLRLAWVVVGGGLSPAVIPCGRAWVGVATTAWADRGPAGGGDAACDSLARLRSSSAIWRTRVVTNVVSMDNSFTVRGHAGLVEQVHCRERPGCRERMGCCERGE